MTQITRGADTARLSDLSTPDVIEDGGRFQGLLRELGNVPSVPAFPPHVELNPVRAGMVEAAEQWHWSSAGVHCGTVAADAMLVMDPWRRRWTPAEWEEFLRAAESPVELRELRRSIHTGRPLGAAEFVAGLEQSTSRQLRARRAGRKKKSSGDVAQLRVLLVA